MTGREKDWFSKERSRREVLKIAGTAALAGMMGPLAAGRLWAGEKKPNILFILTDDHRYDAFSCMGHPVVKTPTWTALPMKAPISETPL